MAGITKESEPMVAGGRLFTGLLTLDHRGLITNIDLIVDGIRVQRGDALQRAAAMIDEPTEIQMRRAIKLRYFDKLTKELVDEY